METEYLKRNGSRLSREFALKTEAERRLLMQICCFPLSCIQTVQMAGKTERLPDICLRNAGRKSLYFAREKKGHEGVKDTVTEDYQGILVHDHDRTFIIMERIIRNALPMCCAI